MNKISVRLRFAPSPTGSLHIGSARTALVNFLYAMHHQGVLVLRIEDTDVLRSSKEHTDAILEMLDWLGISWTEGPYYQSQRHKEYQEFKHKLLASGKAYPCFCSREQLEKQKEEKLKQGLDTIYGGNCRNIPSTEAKRLISNGNPYAIRLKLQEDGLIKFNDLIKGELAFKVDSIGDFIIFRQDNTPTYHYAVVLDDALMNISHVLRGEDHLSNTPKQIALYDALGFTLPKFAHLPLILGPDKTKLSKRHGETSIEEFREKGITPRALLVYLYHLGYSIKSSAELPTTQEMIQQFDLSCISSSPSIFDPQKLSWINRKVIQEYSSKELFDLIKTKISGINLEQEKIMRIISLSKHQANSLNDFYDLLLPFFEYSPQNLDIKELEELSTEDNKLFLDDFMQTLFKSRDYDSQSVEKVFDHILSRHHLSKKNAIRIIRYCATGRLVSPSLFETLDLIGKDELKQRYNLFIKKWA
jgi:glutamyl-tRNA synthetase